MADGSVTQVSLQQEEVGYTSKSADATRRCGLCSHYTGDGACELVVADPKPISELGVCDRFDPKSVEVVVGGTMVSDQQRVHDSVIAEQSEQTGKGYAYLSVHMMWEIERLQMALNTIFGYDEAWRWIDPYTYHITLAYSDDISNDQLLEVVKVVAGMEAIDLHIVGIGSFDNADTDERAIYLKIEKNDALVALQQAVFDSLNGQGVSLSPFSDPAVWVPHMTLAYVPMGTPVPETTLDVTVYSDEVCLARSDYRTLAEVKLEWKPPVNAGEDGSGPVVEMASWKCGAARDLTIGNDDSWDGAAAAKSVFDAAGFDTDAPDTMMARKAFLVFNASAPKLKGSYKLPFAKMVDGKMIAVPAGIRNAASRLPQVKGVPQNVLDRAEKVLNAYKKKAGIGELNSGKTRIRMTMISEMRGNYPDISLPDDIDRKALKELVGDNLFYVTLPIGQAGVKSRNGRTYSRRAVEQMVETINKIRPDGIWGHLGQDDMETRYDPPSIRWLAAMIDNDGVAWGKGLPLNQMTREYYQLARATNAKVGTSIMAYADMEHDEVVELDLRQIDLADPMRVGVPMTAATPKLTAEMANGAGEGGSKSSTDDPAKDDALFDVIERVRAANTPTPSTAEAQVKELSEPDKGASGMDEKEIQAMLDENKRLTTRVSELETAQPNVTRLTELEETVKTQRALIGEFLGAYIAGAAAQACSVNLGDAEDVKRPSHVMVRDYVIAMQPQSKAAVDEAVAKVIEYPHIKEMLRLETIKSNPALDKLYQQTGAGEQLFVIPKVTKEA